MALHLSIAKCYLKIATGKRRPPAVRKLKIGAPDGRIGLKSSFVGGILTVQGETGELWRKLCEQAAVEQDPEKLLELAKEISALLDEKEQRLHRARTIELPDVGSGDHAA